MSRVLLAVDLSYQTYRAAAAHPMLTCGRTFTGGVYGFLATLAKQIRETKATDVVICRDVKPYKRSEVYPEYKQLRKKNADDELLKAFNQSLVLVNEVIDVMGFPTMEAPGFESDDCIGWLVHRHRHRFSMIYASSNDSDLYQLFWWPHFKVLRKDINDVMDLELLTSSLGMSPAEFMLASALQGTHNDIAGIPGVGPKTAYKAVRDPSLMRAHREKHGALIERNLQLIKLPHAEFPSLGLPTSTGRFDERALYRWCGRYDIDVTHSMLNSFEGVSS